MLGSQDQKLSYPGEFFRVFRGPQVPTSPSACGLRAKPAYLWRQHTPPNMAYRSRQLQFIFPAPTGKRCIPPLMLAM